MGSRQILNKKAIVGILFIIVTIMTGCSTASKGDDNITYGSVGNEETSIKPDADYPLLVEFAHWAGEDSKKGEYTVDLKEGAEFSVNQRICDLVVIVDKVSDEKITLKCHYSDNEKKIMTVKLKKGESKSLETPTMDSGGRVIFTYKN